MNLPFFKESSILFNSICLSSTNKYFETSNARCSLVNKQVLNSDSIKYNSRKNSPKI